MGIVWGTILQTFQEIVVLANSWAAFISNALFYSGIPTEFGGLLSLLIAGLIPLELHSQFLGVPHT